MFGKKRCINCGEKVGSSYNFCPYCRIPLKDDGDWGLLGKDDLFSQGDIKLPMGFSTLFNSLAKNLNKQFEEVEKAEKHQGKEKIRKGGISISISTSGNKPPEIKVTSFGNIPELKEQKRQIENDSKKIKLPETDSKKFSGLPKKEPETNIRRMSNKVVYEINIPGVKSIKDVSIVQLENSIEIKALSKSNVFYKIIPINLPIKKYNFAREKLVLELDARD